jgi:hypothetical protein
MKTKTKVLLTVLGIGYILVCALLLFFQGNTAPRTTERALQGIQLVSLSFGTFCLGGLIILMDN